MIDSYNVYPNDKPMLIDILFYAFDSYLKKFYWKILPNWYLRGCNSKLAETRNPTDLCTKFPYMADVFNFLIKDNVTNLSTIS